MCSAQTVPQLRSVAQAVGSALKIGSCLRDPRLSADLCPACGMEAYTCIAATFGHDFPAKWREKSVSRCLRRTLLFGEPLISASRGIVRSVACTLQRDMHMCSCVSVLERPQSRRRREEGPFPDTD